MRGEGLSEPSLSGTTAPFGQAIRPLKGVDDVHVGARRPSSNNGASSCDEMPISKTNFSVLPPDHPGYGYRRVSSTMVRRIPWSTAVLFPSRWRLAPLAEHARIADDLQRLGLRRSCRAPSGSTPALTVFSQSSRRRILTTLHQERARLADLARALSARLHRKDLPVIFLRLGVFAGLFGGLRGASMGEQTVGSFFSVASKAASASVTGLPLSSSIAP